MWHLKPTLVPSRDIIFIERKPLYQLEVFQKKMKINIIITAQLDPLLVIRSLFACVSFHPQSLVHLLCFYLR